MQNGRARCRNAYCVPMQRGHPSHTIHTRIPGSAMIDSGKKREAPKRRKQARVPGHRTEDRTGYTSKYKIIGGESQRPVLIQAKPASPRAVHPFASSHPSQNRPGRDHSGPLTRKANAIWRLHPTVGQQDGRIRRRRPLPFLERMGDEDWRWREYFVWPLHYPCSVPFRNPRSCRPFPPNQLADAEVQGYAPRLMEKCNPAWDVMGKGARRRIEGAKKRSPNYVVSAAYRYGLGSDFPSCL
jgi:hypothetical protein